SQFRGAGEAILWPKRQRLGQESIQLLGDTRHYFRKLRVLRFAHSVQGGDRPARFEGACTCQGGVEDRPHGKEIRAGVHALTLGLLRGHEAKRALHTPRGFVYALARAGNAEVRQLDLSFSRQEDVPGRNISMHNLEWESIGSGAMVGVVQAA